MAKATLIKEGDLHKEYHGIYERAMSLGKSMECVDTVADEDLLISVFVKYYYRVKNYVSLSIICRQIKAEVYVHAITAGGGDSLFNINYGSEEDFLDAFKNIMLEAGYRVVK